MPALAAVVPSMVIVANTATAKIFFMAFPLLGTYPPRGNTDLHAAFGGSTSDPSARVQRDVRNVLVDVDGAQAEVRGEPERHIRDG
ncbi:hypothetical protein Mth01_13470 [Sphaerimonospora thailandensis]|uniref:Uncharacterized protein n=1 Tax=Sphaerimonospora thailandensis TaxID=795644 RepID=A0A8J3VXM4_9ACTN|nr:hypothetical protein Mth01_13470 [Sphaerimonospora thailandensis]